MRHDVSGLRGYSWNRRTITLSNPALCGPPRPVSFPVKELKGLGQRPHPDHPMVTNRHSPLIALNCPQSPTGMLRLSPHKSSALFLSSHIWIHLTFLAFTDPRAHPSRLSVSVSLPVPPSPSYAIFK